MIDQDNDEFKTPANHHQISYLKNVHYVYRKGAKTRDEYFHCNKIMASYRFIQACIQFIGENWST